MKFERLRVLGFKSFVEPMEFVIQDGLTGVVGPNGCGKSNLVEALRWVMGENSYKNMRASGMDDVIFSGSLNRPARNTAEVTLFLDNSLRLAPTGYNDADKLEVTRRIEREAGSVYKINGKDARARDVQLLFADASTGARSPAMVRQGQIGELISAKPTSRRKILEEAAGISGLHSRRHEAEIRLRAAEGNLERLEDVLVQIEAQLEGLKRQARQASRYRNLSWDIRRTEATILYLRWKDASAALQEAQAQYAEAEFALTDIAGLQARTAKDQAIAAHEVPKLRDAAAEVGAALQRIVIAKNQLDAEDRRVRERLTDLNERIRQLDQDIEREEQLTSENAERLEALEEEEQLLTEENESVEERAMVAQERAEEAQRTVSALEADHAEKTRDHAGLMAKRQQLLRSIEDGKGRLTRQSEQMSQLKATLDAISEELSMATEVAEQREALEMAQEELTEAEEVAADLEEALQEAREREAALRQPLSDARGDVTRLETESRTLEKILASTISGDWTPAVDELKVARGLEKALGAALGEDLEVPLDEQAPAHWGGADRDFDDPALPEGSEPLVQYVEAPQKLIRRLDQIGLVEAAEGPGLARKLKVGQRLVSREGDLWRWDGLRVAAEAPTPAAQRLAQKNRLQELAGEIEAAQERVMEVQAQADQAAQAVKHLSGQEQGAKQKVREAQSSVTRARDAVTQAERAHSQLTVKKEGLEEQVARAEEALEELRADLEEAQMQLEELPALDELSEELQGLAEQLSEARSVLSSARASVESTRRESELRKSRLVSILRERQSWMQRAQGADKQIETLRQRRSENEEERQTLLERPEEIEEKRVELTRELAKLEERKRAADDALVEAEKALAEADRKAKEAMEGLSGARERKIRAEERLEAARLRKKETETRVDEALEVSIAELPEVAGLKEGAPLPDAAATEKRLERLKGERERLGGVNLRAEEEMREVQERRDTLVVERDDLIEAIKRLRGGISNLNREARERLLQAFEVVNNHFQRLFSHLFGGGTAELKLVDSEDPLDAGLEIFARPPGKKPQTMTLLSGGEQALTAMAMIFAVFLTNPAPICVLDEVDAPLDDANVERYCALLETMVQDTETRFVVITHNPITMARMDRLFGVTMAERGVSQLVSVDLQTAESFREFD
ncbi:chromosome segregation SMC family protein [Pseudovibrio sp. SPO723]|uniref:chromosome segregation SMC family protein n=1 Tax=Nesiotobacter zosterae TaxID=392721 RepID=UPI0029C27E15|nr:AAA family ATPase [Pseudovibrio sp. SPO723]MDX5593054.1 AAA family ATPase [Pseudovibrio sp. SPO723]